MTLDEIKKSKELFLNPKDVADIIGCDPHKIRVQAKTHPELIGFPVSVIGARVRIPRRPFIQWVEGGESA